jgi:hypothetical protein
MKMSNNILKLTMIMIILNALKGFQLKNKNVLSYQTTVKIRNNLMIRYYNIDKKYDKDYYMGMITNTKTEEAESKDNLTPNLKLGAIFFGILFFLVGSFIYINKDVAPPPY